MSQIFVTHHTNIKCIKTAISVGALPLTATQMVSENGFTYLRICRVEYVTDCCYTSYEYNSDVWKRQFKWGNYPGKQP